MPVQGLYYSGWAQARRFAVALNIGTRGLWWWHFAKDVSRYYEIVKDLEQNQTVELDQQPRLALNWGSHLILSDRDLALTQRCLVALPFPHESDKLAPFDYYVAALNFWAHIDVHWRCEILIYGNFHESLKAMTRRVGGLGWKRSVRGCDDDHLAEARTSIFRASFDNGALESRSSVSSVVNPRDRTLC